MQFESESTTDTVKRQFPVTMTFRCTPSERDVIRRRADETGQSLSSFLRKRATGGHTSQPIQDAKDLAQLKQHLGLVKQWVSINQDTRSLLKGLEALIAKMSSKVS